jgi:hypothetical protein
LIAIVVLIALALLGVVVYLVLQRRSDRRDHQLRDFASARSMSYDATEYLFDPAESLVYQLKQQQPEAMRDVQIPVVPLPVEELSQLPLLGGGVSRQLRNLMIGTVEDGEIQVFDFSNTISVDEDGPAPSYRRTVVRIRSSRLALPLFTLTPKGPRSQVARALFPSVAAEDVDLAGFPALSSMYWLTSSDAERARALLTPPVVDFLARGEPLSVEGNGDQFVLYGGGTLYLDAQALSALYTRAVEFYRLLGH